VPAVCICGCTLQSLVDVVIQRDTVVICTVVNINCAFVGYNKTKKNICIVLYSSGQELSIVHKFRSLVYGICCRLALEWV